MKELRRVFGYVVRYPWFAVGTLLCALLSTLAGLAYPKLIGKAVDEVIGHGQADQLLPTVLFLAGAFFFRDLFNALRILLNNTFEQKVIFDLRADLYDTMQKLPLGWFDNRASGDLMTRVTEDVTNMERVLVDGIEQGIIALLQIIGVGAVLFYINPSLSLWSMAPIPLLILGALLYTKTAHKRYRIIRRATSSMNSLLLDNLQGIFQIKSFGREKRELDHFNKKSEDVRQGTLIVMRAWAAYNPSMNFLSFLGIVLVLYFGGRDAMTPGSGFTIGHLVTFLFYINMFYDPVNRLHQLNQLFQSGRAAAERVYAILDTPREPDPTSPASLPAAVGHAREVVFENITFSYQEDRAVLHDISLQASPGETIALVGPTGAGKSSLVKLLPRFYPLASGRILIDGVAHADLTLEELRSQIGIVSQEAFMFNATVRENLLHGKPGAGEEEIFAALEAANAAAFVRNLPKGLDTIVGERGVKLSVGEKQRLSIARALLKNPPILILDEATASVDTETELLIQQALDRLLENRTSFVIAHRLSTVRNAHQICVLRDGRLIEHGTHAELSSTDGLYARLCRAQHTGETIEEAFRHLG